MGHLAAVAAAAACTFTWHGVPSPALWGAQLNAVAASAADDAWAVGGPGARGNWTRPLVEHWNGKGWRSAASPDVEGATLQDVAVVGRDDAWAVGGDLLEHWDGARWRRVSVPWLTDLTAVAATARDDVWAVGKNVVAHWDGVRWRVRLRSEGVRGVTALAPNDVWVVAAAGRRFVELHWDGRRWTRYSEPVSADNLRAVAVSAAGPDDVWAVANDDFDGPTWHAAVLFHWTGKRWRRVQPPPKVFLFVNDLLVTGTGELWLTAYRADGDAYGGGVRGQLTAARWQETDTGQLVALGLGADRAGGLWGVGSAGSYPNGLGFPTLVRPLIERARCR